MAPPVRFGFSRSRLAALIEPSKSSPSLPQTVDSATGFRTLGIWNPLLGARALNRQLGLGTHALQFAAQFAPSCKSPRALVAELDLAFFGIRRVGRVENEEAHSRIFYYSGENSWGQRGMVAGVTVRLWSSRRIGLSCCRSSWAA
jgi:hypothetical protein